MYKAHVFICTNNPENPLKCGAKGSAELHARVKANCHQRFPGKEIRINKSGCLGFCEQGIAAVIYPEGKWLLNLEGEDDRRLMEAIEESQTTRK